MNNSDFLALSAPSSRTLSDHVAVQLRHAILADKLKPGQRLLERDIAEAMGTSRGPVRDALRELESEGLVVHYPHRGTFVARLTLQDAEEIYTLRKALETLAVEYAIESATPEDIEALDRIVDSIAAEMDEEYSQHRATDLDLEFHRALCRMSGHRRVISAWESLSVQIRLLLLSHRTLDPSDWAERGVVWHRSIVEAVRQRDVDTARREVQRHLASSFENVAKSFATRDET